MPEKDYSGTPLHKKLGIKEGSSVALLRAPDGFVESLGPLPPGVTIKDRARGPLDVIVLFVRRETDLLKRFETLARALDPSGGLWVSYPKKSSQLETDLTFEIVQTVGLAEGLVDNKSIAVDDHWSGVRFVYRLKDRPR